MLEDIRGTIKRRVEQVYGVREDRRQGYTDDWEAIIPELESRISNQTSLPPVRRQTEPRALSLEEDWEDPNQPQGTDTSFHFSQTSIARELGLLDSDPLSPSHSREWTVGPPGGRPMSPSQSSRLSLSLEESQESEVSLAAICHREQDVEDGRYE